MIRAALLSFMLLASHVHAQDNPFLDMAMLRTSAPDLDRWYPPGLVVATLVSTDRHFYDQSPAHSVITADIARFLVGDAGTTDTSAFEAQVTIALVDEFTHDELLVLWFQSTYFGNNCTGIDAAMETLIGKPTNEGTLVDFLTLMILPSAPTATLEDSALQKRTFEQFIEHIVADEHLPIRLAQPLISEGPTRIISSNFCNL